MSSHTGDIVAAIEAKILNISRRLQPFSVSASPALHSQASSVARDSDQRAVILGDDVSEEPPKEEVTYNSSLDGEMPDYQAYLTFLHEGHSRNERPSVSFAEYIAIANTFGRRQEKAEEMGEGAEGDEEKEEQDEEEKEQEEEEAEDRYVKREGKGKQRAE